jgi:hypothetical protein
MEKSHYIYSGYGKHKGAQGGERPEIVFSGLKDPQTPEAIVTDILKTYRSTGE